MFAWDDFQTRLARVTNGHAYVILPLLHTIHVVIKRKVPLTYVD